MCLCAGERVLLSASMCDRQTPETATPMPQKAETPFLQKRLAMLLTECGVTHCAVLPLSRGAHGPKTPRALSHFFHLPATSIYISAIATCPGVSLSQLPPIASVVTSQSSTPFLLFFYILKGAFGNNGLEMQCDESWRSLRKEEETSINCADIKFRWALCKKTNLSSFLDQE